MPRAAPILLSFNAGELSPLLDSRIDLEKHPAGCRQMVNMRPAIQGAAVRRPGTRFYGATKTQAERGWLLRFVFSRTDAYWLEFGDQYVRFWTVDGQVESSPGVPLEVATPWPIADLTTAEGTCSLQVEQSGDVLYIAGGGKPPQTLSRISATSWTLAEYDPDDGPFLDKNKAEAVTLQASAETGSVTITAASSLFASGDVGRLVRLWEQNPSLIKPWKAGESVSAGDQRRSDGKVYEALGGGSTGGDKPVHEEGDGSDGVVEWRYLHAGYGVARIAAFTSATEVTADVVTTLPDSVVSDATWKWELGAWGEVPGYPDAVAFYRERLSWAEGRRLFQSAVDDFAAHRDRTAGEVLADDALVLKINGSRVNRIIWIADDEALAIGMDAAEFVVRKITESDPYGADNIEAKPATAYGSWPLAPVRCHDRLLFVDRSGQRVREFVYRFETDRYKAEDLTRLAPHICAAGIVDMAWQGTADTLWCVLADGSLAGMSYDPEQAVVSWHRHRLADGMLLAESVECIPTESGDAVMILARMGDGASVKRWLLRLEDAWALSGPDGGGDERGDARFLDAAILYDGSPTDTIAGLDHLDGLECAVLADGAVLPSDTPDGGTITLRSAKSRVLVGLPCTWTLEPMLLEAGAADGTAQGKAKRISEVRIRVRDTAGLEVSADGATWDSLDRRSPSTPMGMPEPLRSGLLTVKPWPSTWEEDARIILRGSSPLPAHVLAIMPVVTTSS